jgi:hypothetical protein
MKSFCYAAVVTIILLPLARCLNAQSGPLTQDAVIGHLETVATFDGPMPTGVTVSRTNRIFVNFPRWGDNLPFTVAELVHGKAVAYPDAMVNDWPGRKVADPPISSTSRQMRRTSFPCSRSLSTLPNGCGCSIQDRPC